MEILYLQLLLMGLIFVCTTCVGVTPILLGRFFSRKFSINEESKARFLSDASCFGAGVFLFVCFLGLLPDADEKFHVILKNLGDENEKWEEFAEFPWGFFVVTCGFLVIFTIDKLVHAIEHSKSKPSGDATSISQLLTPSVNQTIEIKNPAMIQDDVKKSQLNYECHLAACGIYEESHSGVPSSVMFLIALSAHSVFEGVAVGLQTSKDKIMEYSVAVLLHEAVMALTFGLEVSKSPMKKRTKLMYVIIFTLSIPVGIAIGMVLQNTPSENREIISAIIEAFATGIFIHVIFIEILSNEFPHLQFDRHKCRLSTPLPVTSSRSRTYEICLLIEKIFCICCGLALLSLINVFLHGHAH
ncbi:UNVERIFIED_CONTAM: hypothetical protein RMT77_012936 [Armadillidium vulgare]